MANPSLIPGYGQLNGTGGMYSQPTTTPQAPVAERPDANIPAPPKPWRPRRGSTLQTLGWALLGIANPRVALEAARGYMGGKQAQSAQELDRYDTMLPVWQRQQSEQAREEEQERQDAETQRYHTGMLDLGANRIDAGTFGRVLPYDPSAAAGLPGAPEGFTPTPGGMGTLAKNAATVANADTNIAAKVAGMSGDLSVLSNRFPGLSLTPNGTMARTGAQVAELGAKLPGVVADASVKVNTVPSRSKAPGIKNNHIVRTTQAIGEDQQAKVDAERIKRNNRITDETLQYNRDIAKIRLREANTRTRPPKPVKPRKLNVTERNEAQIEKSNVDPETWKQYKALGIAPGPQASATFDYYANDGLIVPNYKKVPTGQVDAKGQPLTMMVESGYKLDTTHPSYPFYIQKQKMWKNGDLKWVDGREVATPRPKVRPSSPKAKVAKDTWKPGQRFDKNGNPI